MSELSTATNHKHALSLLNRYGINLFCLYILVGYLANDIILPKVINTIVLYLFMMYGAVYALISGNLKFNWFNKWQLFFIVLSIISLIYSPLENIFEGQFYLVIVNFVLIYFLSRFTVRKNEIIKIGWFYTAGASSLIILLIQSGHIFDVSGRLGHDLVGNANILSGMLMISVFYNFWILIYGKNSLLGKVILICFVGITYYGMFLTGGRKYILIPFIFLYIILFLRKDKNGKKHILRNTLIVVAFLAIVYYLIMFVPALYDVIGYRMESLIMFLEEGQGYDGGAEELRSKMIKIAMDKWSESPIIGHGFDSFKYYNAQTTGRFFYSHNNFVELLYNLGAVGFVAYYLLYYKMIAAAWKKRNIMPQYATTFVIALFISMIGYEYGQINYSGTTTFIAYYLSFALLNQSSVKESQSVPIIRD